MQEEAGNNWPCAVNTDMGKSYQLSLQQQFWNNSALYTYIYVLSNFPRFQKANWLYIFFYQGTLLYVLGVDVILIGKKQV